jgi:hypothetical protein
MGVDLGQGEEIQGNSQGLGEAQEGPLVVSLDWVDPQLQEGDKGEDKARVDPQPQVQDIVNVWSEKSNAHHQILEEHTAKVK